MMSSQDFQRRGLSPTIAGRYWSVPEAHLLPTARTTIHVPTGIRRRTFSPWSLKGSFALRLFFHPIWVSCILLGCLSSIGRCADLHRFDFEGHGMGTTFRCILFAANRVQADQAMDACYQRFHELAAMLTDYEPTSELLELCNPEKGYPRSVSDSLFKVLKRSCEIAESTDGAFDPTCGHLSQLWRRAYRRHALPDDSERLRALERTDWRRVTFHEDRQSVSLAPETRLDLGGIAKGFAADECLGVLRKSGFPRAVIQIGGDTAVGDPPPNAQGWPIALKPNRSQDQSDSEITISARNCGVSTSGDHYQHAMIAGRRYSHIVSTTHHGLGLENRITCSVMASDCTTSDGLATALCVLEPERRQAFIDRHPDLQVWVTSDDVP